MIIRLLFIFVIASSLQLQAQNCGITVDAGEDLFICTPVGNVNLSGQVSGNFSGVQWTPATGVTFPNSLNTPAMVNGTTTYTLTAFGNQPTSNLVFNGDFSQGATGFTSSYSPGTGGAFGLLSNEGEYAVLSNSGAAHNNFASCNDHTGGGNMMVVNGATTANQNIWCQTVPVTPNSSYAFSAWITSVISENPAILQFAINGQLLGGAYNASSVLCAWGQYNATWNSGIATSATICITNQNTAGSGNDFAIDDIVFGPVCSDSDEVTVSILDIQAVIAPPGQFPCNGNVTTITLNGTGSSAGPGIIYQWSTNDGNIVNGHNTLMPEIDEPGTYTLNVSYPPGGPFCFDPAMVTVTENTNAPTAVANAPEEINCNQSLVTISGQGSSEGPEFTYEWTTTDGNIVNGGTTLMPEVDEIGTYTLTVTNTSNNCNQTVDVTVTGNNTPPTIIIIPPEEITCTNGEVFLDATNSDSGPDFTFSWITLDGNIVSGDNTLSPSVDLAGTYELTIENTTTGCIEMQSVTVSGDNAMPIAVAEPTPPLTCTQTTAFLNGQGSSEGPEYIYDWVTFDGNILSGATTLNPQIDAPGTYTLTVTNVLNDCFETTTVTVGGNTIPPEAVIATPVELDCNTMNTILDGTGSATGPSITYQWTTIDGIFINGETSSSPEINGPGEYTLTVMDSSTGCEAVISTTVIANTEEPDIEFIEPEPLACGAAVLTIDASLSSTGDEFVYTWTTSNGNIVSGENTLLLDVNESGIYELMIENSNTGCTVMDMIEVFGDTNTPIADAGEPLDFFCNTESLILDGNDSDSGDNLVYEWTTDDGNIIADETTLNPTIDAPGVYTLTVTDLSNDCMATDVVEIVADLTPPFSDAGTPQNLTCAVDTLVLDASNSDSGNDITYLWTTDDGNIIADETTVNPIIDASGTYELLVTNNFTGCSATTTVFIGIDDTLPTAEAGDNEVITCAEESVSLDAGNSSAANDFSLSWTTENGAITGDDNSTIINTNTIGTYFLTITDDTNGCVAVDSVVVTENTTSPMVVVNEPDSLTCVVTSIVLDGEEMGTDNDYTYLWETQNGNIISEETTLNPTIDATGLYELTATDAVNGCTTSIPIVVQENTNPPIADAGSTATLTCAEPSLILNGNNSDTGAEYSYHWQTTDGNIVADATTLTPTIDAMGTYELIVTNNNNGCTTIATVAIDEDLQAPNADAGQSAELSCTLTEIILNGADSDTGPNISYQWTSPNGNIIANADQVNPTVNAAGDYFLEVTNTLNGCSSIASVNITQDDSTPTAAAGTADDLTCLVEILTLDAGNSSIGDNFTYQWTTENGNILSGETTLNPTIDEPGIYVITVLNQDNNCQSFSSVTVVENTTPPNADAGMDVELTCSTSSLSLDASASNSPNGVSYEWSSIDGNIVSGQTSAQPVIDATGTYVLTITDNLTGCTATDMVEVGEDENIPTVIATVAENLTCTTEEVLLNGLASDMGANFTYEWTHPNGNVINDATDLELLVSDAGIYTLQVTNTDNGCSNATTVEVVEDLTTPIAQAGTDEVLDCQTTTLTLNGQDSDQGNIYTYQWETNNGNITNGANTLSPSIDQAGTYQLIVTNTENGCTAMDEVLIENDENAPNTIIAEAGMLTCSVNSIILDASASDNDANLTLLWTTDTGNIQSGEDGLNPTINQAGIYTLTLTNPDNGCEASTSITIEANTTTPSADAGTAEVLNCNLNQIPLQGTSDGGTNLAYEWTTDNGQIVSGSSTLNPIVSATGTYTLVVINTDNDCTESDTITVTENNPTAFDFDIDLPNCVEPTGDISFLSVEGGVSPYLYSIDGGASFGTAPIFNTLESGNYSLIVQDANGCELEDAVFIPTTTDIQISLETSVELTLGESHELNAVVNIPEEDIANITWTPTDSLSCTGCLNPTAMPNETTLYQIYLEDVNGCTAESQIELFVDRRVAVYIPNAFSPDKNGENDVFYIHAKEGSVKEVQQFIVLDRWGETVFEDYNFQANNPANGWDGLFNGNLLNPSVFVYVAILEMADGRMEMLTGDVSLLR